MHIRFYFYYYLYNKKNNNKNKMITDLPILPIRGTSDELSFVEWLKKKPDNSKWNHYELTKEWGLRLIGLLNTQEKLYLKTPDDVFIKKFQYFLYKRSSKNPKKYIYYFK